MSNELFIGLMTGTSVDGIDAALVRFDGNSAVLEQTLEYALPERLRNRLQALIHEPGATALDDIGQAGSELAAVSDEAVAELLRLQGHESKDITAIGFHGQTVRHMPDGDSGFTLQLGNGSALSVRTGIDVVCDFRAADVALGGQGAPLAPAFHEFAFSGPEARVIVNIGGIANVTLLAPDSETVGFDTGPGNTLLDDWCREHTGKEFDEGGAWGARGEVIPDLLGAFLSDSYFSETGPKSTGREHFNRQWLDRHLGAVTETSAPADVQATLTELTASSIVTAVQDNSPEADIFVCGGGARNDLLMQRIAALHSGGATATTSELGIHPDWVEAAAFAWLARARLRGEPGNLPAVTGASRPAILGALHRH